MVCPLLLAGGPSDSEHGVYVHPTALSEPPFRCRFNFGMGADNCGRRGGGCMLQSGVEEMYLSDEYRRILEMCSTEQLSSLPRPEMPINPDKR